MILLRSTILFIKIYRALAMCPRSQDQFSVRVLDEFVMFIPIVVMTKAVDTCGEQEYPLAVTPARNKHSLYNNRYENCFLSDSASVSLEWLSGNVISYSFNPSCQSTFYLDRRISSPFIILLLFYWFLKPLKQFVMLASSLISCQM